MNTIYPLVFENYKDPVSIVPENKQTKPGLSQKNKENNFHEYSK